MSGHDLPPRLAARLARWLLSSADAMRLLEALDEEYLRFQCRERSRIGARLWYWRQVVRSIPALRAPFGPRRAHSLLVDLLHLSRTLRRSPWSALAAVLTLAVTLGAGASIASVVQGVLLQPSPFTDPDALVSVGESSLDDPGAAPRAVPRGTLLEWRERAAPLADLEAYDPANVTLTELGTAERLAVNDVTPGFLELLGVAPSLGRIFSEDDLGHAVAILTHDFWIVRLASDPGVLDRSVVLNGQPHRIVGVLPAEFHFPPNRSEVWRPLPSLSDGTGDRVRVVGRLIAGATPGDLSRALADVRVETASDVRVASLTDVIAGDTPRTIALLAGAGGLAILIAFANLTVLLLVRSIDRRRELAVRRALGAPASETARQLVLEAFALTLAGIGAGVVIASWATPSVARLTLQFAGVTERDVGLHWGAVVAVSLVALGCALTCGLLPTFGPRGGKIGDALRTGATSSAGEVRFRRALVAGEVAVAFVLLLSMSLVGLSLGSVLRRDPGFEPEGVLTFQVSLPQTRYPSGASVVEYYASLQRALEERLGETRVSLVDELPLSGDGGRRRAGVQRDALSREVVVRSAAPGYFEVLRIPVIAGRGFTAQDAAGAGARVVITTSLAEGLFGVEGSPGSRIWVEGLEQMAEVVGVVGEVRHRALDEALLPTVYLSAMQFPSASSVVVTRSPQPDEEVTAAVRSEVRRLDGDLPVYGIRPMGEVVAASPGVPARRLLAAMLAGFALLSVALSSIGLFGAVAHEVSGRRSEIALRMALGADPGRIVRATLARGVGTAGAGLAAGAVIAVWAVRGLGHLLVVGGGGEVFAIGAVVASLLATIGIAAVVPVALDAARSDPATLLHGE